MLADQTDRPASASLREGRHDAQLLPRPQHVAELARWAMHMRWRRTSPEPPPRPKTAAPDLLARSQVVDVSRLSDYAVNAAEDYLREFGCMNVFAGAGAGRRLVSVVEA